MAYLKCLGKVWKEGLGERVRKVRDLLRVMETSFDDTIRALGRALDLRHAHYTEHLSFPKTLSVPL